MHNIKSKAKHTAWRGDGNTPTTRMIPYAGRRGHSRNSSVDPEQGSTSPLDHTKSAPAGGRLNIGNSDDGQNELHTNIPNRAQTMPTTPTSAIPEESQSVSSPESTSPPNTSKQSTLMDDNSAKGTNMGGPRKRRHLRIPFAHKEEGAEDEPSVEKAPSSESKKTSKLHKHIPVGQQIKAVFWQWPNVLLICVPIGIALNFSGVNPLAVFLINFLAIVPLAATLSFATEEIAMRVGQTLGGLLNASFGNATELIVAIIALAKNEILIVQTSLIGSMLSNLLLVLGMCFALGGWNRVEQHFNMTVAQTACSLLILAAGSLIIPTVYVQWADAPDSDSRATVPKLSRGTAVILLFVYGCYLLFQLRTHIEMYNTPSQKAEKRHPERYEEKNAAKKMALIGARNAAHPEQDSEQTDIVHEQALVDQEREEEEEPSLSTAGALITLAVSTALIGLCSEFVVDSISYVTTHNHVSPEFVGLILLPIVGNAAEHATAITVAIKDKMDLAIGVAVGSSMQIALLVIPLSVVIGWIIEGVHGVGEQEPMTLNFDGFVIAVLFITVLLVNYLIQDGKSHWLEGVMLMTTYVIIAVAAWFYPTTAAVAG
ncbi:MAG: hypothetical protein M1831_001691 [Alyxoria varia]|nr:MAG: hypothetical protein M1831_001691 [Alyxoria varia]